MKEYRVNIPVLLSIITLFSLTIAATYLRMSKQLTDQEIGQLIINYSLVTIPIGLTWWFFEHYGWRMKFFKFLLGKLLKFPPDLRGRWEGTLDRIGADAPHKIVFEIAQTFTKIKVRTYSANSESSSIVCDFATDANWEDLFWLGFMWQGEASNALDGTSNEGGQFSGYSHLKYVESNNELVGKYWTNKRPTLTSGDHRLTWVSLDKKHTF